MAENMCVATVFAVQSIHMQRSTAKYVRGLYAVRVKGRIPEDVEAELENRGIKYRSREQTDDD